MVLLQGTYLYVLSTMSTPNLLARGKLLALAITGSTTSYVLPIASQFHPVLYSVKQLAIGRMCHIRQELLMKVYIYPRAEFWGSVASQTGRSF